MKKKILIPGAMMMAMATASFTLYTSSVSQAGQTVSLLMKNVEALSAWTESREEAMLACEPAGPSDTCSITVPADGGTNTYNFYAMRRK